MTVKLNLPLMEDNITREDVSVLTAFLAGLPRLTQSENVRAFEREWSAWLGVKHSVFVNSGASANLLTMAALKEIAGPGEVIVPPLTWVSDIASVMQVGLTPVFADIDPRTLGLSDDAILAKVTPRTRAVFLTHVQGFNALTRKMVDELARRGIPLIEDVCESHGAMFEGKKCGSVGFASNFSFYFAHHMSTIEGGMVCTNDDRLHQMVRMMRSHGMVRESSDETLKARYIAENPALSPDFIFAFPSWNMRSTEINAVLGRSQLKRLDANNARRRANFKLFLSLLDPAKYRTDFDTETSSNYAFCLVIRKPDLAFRDRLEAAMREVAVEFRRGSSGGGNQMRQPYLRGVVPPGEWEKFPEVEHIHSFGYYIGNYPTLSEARIRALVAFLNGVS